MFWKILHLLCVGEHGNTEDLGVNTRAHVEWKIELQLLVLIYGLGRIMFDSVMDHVDIGLDSSQLCRSLW